MQDNHLAKTACHSLFAVSLPYRRKTLPPAKQLFYQIMKWALSHELFQHEAQMLPTAQRRNWFSRHYSGLLSLPIHDSITKYIHCVEDLS